MTAPNFMFGVYGLDRGLAIYDAVVLDGFSAYWG